MHCIERSRERTFVPGSISISAFYVKATVLEGRPMYCVMYVTHTVCLKVKKVKWKVFFPLFLYFTFLYFLSFPRFRDQGWFFVSPRKIPFRPSRRLPLNVLQPRPVTEFIYKRLRLKRHPRGRNKLTEPAIWRFIRKFLCYIYLISPVCNTLISERNCNLEHSPTSHSRHY